MTKYLKNVKDLVVKFDKHIIQQISREENSRADALSKFGAMVAEIKDMKITVVVKERASSDEVEIVHCVTECELWKSEIEEKLIKGTEPGDQIAAKGLKYRVNRFTILNVELYRRSIEGPLLKCISPEKAHFVLREIPEVSYSNHSGRRSLA
ncbi:UNVERIFIED_CONTAM: hypothetical protein Sradi_6151100 [Sesamum radiatum]|uniref:RNase H type-1 domain-containing protein n=1 Tax=Sesamum radiatum TaxID=300843 RepID=A0AAW2KLI8_SESRA